jgi:beta-aspartyl-peptidase (threonine type)
VLKAGGSSLDAVEAAVRVLEDDPQFNAGRGAVFDAEGKNYLDAAIMDGSNEAGAVAQLTTTKNPVRAARAVMEHSRHVLLAGAGADQFAREQGIEQVDPKYFFTAKRWQDYLDWKKEHVSALSPRVLDATPGPSIAMVRWAPARRMAIRCGHLHRWPDRQALGPYRRYPAIGSGTYAIDNTCAVSATGTGEYFIREAAGRQVCDRIAWRGESVAEAGRTPSTTSPRSAAMVA